MWQHSRSDVELKSVLDSFLGQLPYAYHLGIYHRRENTLGMDPKPEVGSFDSRVRPKQFVKCRPVEDVLLRPTVWLKNTKQFVDRRGCELRRGNEEVLLRIESSDLYTLLLSRVDDSRSRCVRVVLALSDQLTVSDRTEAKVNSAVWTTGEPTKIVSKMVGQQIACQRFEVFWESEEKSYSAIVSRRANIAFDLWPNRDEAT